MSHNYNNIGMVQAYSTNTVTQNESDLRIQLQPLTKEQLINVIVAITNQTTQLLLLLSQSNIALRESEALLIEADAAIEVFMKNSNKEF